MKRSTLLRLLKVGVSLVLVAGLAVWLGRDLPRWGVERLLASALGAEVELGGLELPSWRRAVLHRLRIEGIDALPAVATVAAERVEAEGTIRELLGRHLRRLRLTGLELRLVPAPFEPSGEPLPRIDRLTLEPASITVVDDDDDDDGDGDGDGDGDADGDGGTSFEVAGEVRGIGGAADAGGGGPTGEVRLRAGELRLAPLLALVAAAGGKGGAPALSGTAADVDATLRLEPETVDLSATAGALSVRSVDGARGVSLPDLRADLRVDGLRLAAPALAGLRGELDLRTSRLTFHSTGETVELPAARIVGSAAPAADDPEVIHVEVRPSLPFVDQAHLAADWETAARRPRRVEARLVRLRLDPLPLSLPVDGEVDAELTGAGDRLDYRVTARPRRVALAGGAVDTPGATVELRGEVPFPPPLPETAPAVVDLLRLLAGPIGVDAELPAVRGAVGGVEPPASLFPVTLHFDGELVDGELDAGAPSRSQPPRLRGAASVATASAGRVSADGEVAFPGVGGDGDGEGGNGREDGGGRIDADWRWRGGELPRLVAVLRELGVEPPPGVEVAGTATADGRVIGSFDAPEVAAPEVTGTLTLSEIAVSGVAASGDGEPSWRVDGVEGHADFAWRSGGELRWPEAEVAGTLHLPDLEPLPWSLVASGRSAQDLTRGRVESAVLELPVGRLSGDGRWAPATGDEPWARGKVHAEELAFDRGWRLLAPTLADPELAAVAVEGTAGAELDATVDDAGGWRLSGGLSVDGAGFASADGQRVMEGLAVDGQLEVTGTPEGPITARATGRAGGFLLLWGTFFGDFSGVTSDLELTARTEPGAVPGGAGRWRTTADVAVPEGPVVTAALESPGDGGDGNGDGGAEELAYELDFEVADLEATHRRHLREVLAERFDRLELGGRLAAHLSGTVRPAADAGADAGWSVEGVVEVADFRWRSGGGEAVVRGFDLSLPLDLHRPAGGDGSDDDDDGELTGSRRRGRLRFERIRLRELSLPAVDSVLWVEADSVGIEEPVELPVAEGRVIFERLSLRRLLAPDRHLLSGLRLAGLSLERISEDLGVFPLEGALEGHLPQVRLSADELRVEGGGQFSVFGGTVEVGDISGREILTPFPRLTFSADLREIDLGQLTRRIEFGEMTGILSGTVTDCEIFRDVPVRCEATFRTVDRPGVRTTVDVKAIENLTILGTGQGTNVLDRGLRRFLDRYTYRSLGVYLRLRGDELLLRGLEERGDKELFLKGRFPFPIDVVNARPGQTVSFQTMQRRLQSVDLGGVRTDSGG